LPDRGVTGQNLANRRGLLLGMTLAEVMLIILFCLLLLLGKYFLDLTKEREIAAACEACKNAEWIKQLTESDLEKLKVIVDTVLDLRESDRSEAWKILTDDAKRMASQVKRRKQGLGEAEPKPEDKDRQLEEARKRIEQLEKRNEQLEQEIRKMKAGSPPPCIHEPSRDGVELRGPSIPLGTVHIEDGRMTLIAKNDNIGSLAPVDYVGNPFDYQEAGKVLETWPVNRPLTLSEFGRYGREFVRIGDDESNGKLKCRFTMVYYIRDGVPHSMFVDEFLQYFYMQDRLTTDEFEKLK
jgi:hypothetical protein